MINLLGIPSSERPKALEEIKAAICFNRKKGKSLNLHERLLSIQLLLQGKSMEDIAELTGRNRSTIYNYANDYRESGLDGLLITFYKGSESKLTQEQETILSETIQNKTPVEEGFEVEMNWTSPLIRKWIEDRFNIAYSDRGARNLLERLGFTYTKPTYTLAKADPVKQEAFKEAFEEVKKNF